MVLSEFQKVVCEEIARRRITDFRTFFEVYQDAAVGSTKPFIGRSSDPKLFRSHDDVLLFEVLHEFISLLKSLEREGLVFLEHVDGKKMIRVSVPMEEIRFKVHALLQQFQKTEIVASSEIKNFVKRGYLKTEESKELKAPRTKSTISSNKKGIDIFICHSSVDKEFVERLIDLLRSALNIPSANIRCTSIDGYRLPAGATTD